MSYFAFVIILELKIDMWEWNLWKIKFEDVDDIREKAYLLDLNLGEKL